MCAICTGSMTVINAACGAVDTSRPAASAFPTWHVLNLSTVEGSCINDTACVLSCNRAFTA